MYLLEGRKSEADGGASGPVLIGEEREVIVAQLGAAWSELVRRGVVYLASNQAGIAAGAGLTTSSKNFTLYNPLDSGKNLHILEIVGQCTVDPAADAAWWLVGNLSSTQAAPSAVTSETVRNALLGGAGGVGQVYNTATLAATPVVIRPLFGVGWGSGVGFANLYLKDRIDGGIVVPPGVYVSIQASAAVTGVWGMTWAELVQ